MASTQQALDPSWTPANMITPPFAWYVADMNPAHVDAPDGYAYTWHDVRGPGHGPDISQGYYGRPQLQQFGWNGDQPTLTFNNSVLYTDPNTYTWPGAPIGSDAAFAVFAVLRSAQSQDAAIASWWGSPGFIWAGMKGTNGQTLPDLTRAYSIGDGQDFTSTVDLAQGRHVVVWRYAAETMKLTVDGTTMPSAPLATIPEIASLPFIVGAYSTLPTGLFTGDLSELAVVQGDVSDADVENFVEYARNKWHGLPTHGPGDPCFDSDGNPTATTTRCDDHNGDTFADHCSDGVCAGIDPAPGSPADLGPTAWYHANAWEVGTRDGGIENWFDRTGNHFDLTQTFYAGRPTLLASGFNGHPTLQFSGGQLMRRDAWTGVPNGTGSAFSVLAVLSANGNTQDAGIASWWNSNGSAKVWCQLKSSGTSNLLDLNRTDDFGTREELTGNVDLGTGGHVVVWRYEPEVLKITLDGRTVTTTNPTGLSSLNPDTFILGALSALPTGIFKGNISELALIGRSITDAEVDNFGGYAHGEWGTTSCAANCSGKACGADNGCGGTCECGPPCTLTSQCAIGFSCSSGTCQPGSCGNGVKDGSETDVDCGGSCPACPATKGCSTNADCGSGLVCGSHNGACFSGTRAQNVCWPMACADGVTPDECGHADSACGQNCGCVAPCNSKDPNTTCPAGEVCKAGLGHALGSPATDVCVESVCPSNDPALCGGDSSLCGPCVCTPNCAAATCQNPDDGCNGICPGVCGNGQPTVGGGAACQPGAVAAIGSDGVARCLPIECTQQAIAPPLCGTSTAFCGPVCPTCTPDCAGKQCGEDLKCGTSCGTCGNGMYCNDGQCSAPTASPLPTIPGAGGAPTPVADLPDSPTSPVGATPGTLTVTEQGTAQYTIPIEVPPGRAGIEPKLSLQYGGSPESGDLGLGWRLMGLSKITRCPHISAISRYAAPVNQTTTDKFCLDGNRLWAIDPVDGGTATYGQEGSEYRTVVDTFSKVISHVDSSGGVQPEPQPGVTILDHSEQGPDSFQVFTKDGHILTFGATNDSLMMAPNGVRLAWLLNRIEDRAHNTVFVNYEHLGALMQSGTDKDLPTALRPSSIVYTGHGDAPGNREVRFSYETRLDPSTHYYQGGVVSVTSGRLSRVTTYVNGSPVKNYHLQYKDQDLSQLSSVSECVGDADSPCKNPTTFTYEDNQSYTLGNPYDLSSGLQLDANGDGIPDFIATNESVDGVASDPVLQGVQIATDIGVAVATSFASTGVGIGISIAWTLLEPEFFGLFEKSPKVNISTSLLLGTGNRQSPTNPKDASGLPCLGVPGLPTFVFDYNRDGKDDIAMACPFGGIGLSLSNGDGTFSPVSSFVTLPPPLNPNGDGDSVPAQPVFFDADGDGLEDLLTCSAPCVAGPLGVGGDCAGRDYLHPIIELRLRTNPLDPSASQFSDSPLRIDTSLSDQGPYCGNFTPTYNIFDIDGDGTSDLLVANQFTGKWYVLRMEPPGTGPGLYWQQVPFDNVANSQQGGGLRIGDVNGDGLLDVAGDFHSSHQTAAWINTGHGTFLARTLRSPDIAFDPSQYPDGIPHYAGTLFLDYNADGRSDFLQHWENDADTHRSYNLVLEPDGTFSKLTAEEARDLYAPNASGTTTFPARISLAADVDGDGNRDFVGPSGVFYGGSKRRRLATITDGVGNFTGIGYDVPGTYQMDCQGPTWPDMCVKKMSSLVSVRTDGFLGAGGTPVPERKTTFTYRNAHVNVTGYGWLGFEQRQEVEAPASGVDQSPYQTTTTEYELPARYTIDGHPVTDELSAYAYPLAGLPKTVIVDRVVSVDNVEPQPLENGRYGRRVRTENTWSARKSAAGVTFPELDMRTTTTYDRPLAPLTIPPTVIPLEENGTLLNQTVETFSTDTFGNVLEHDEMFLPGENGDPSSAYAATVTKTAVFPDASTWLISQPAYVSVRSSRGPDDLFSTFRHWHYFYTNGVLTEVDRGYPGDGAQGGSTDEQHNVQYILDDYGNHHQIIESAPGETTRTTTVNFDADNVYPVSIVNSLNQVSQVHFDPRWGQPETMVDPNNVVEQHSHDGFGRLGRVVRSTGSSVYSYFPIAPGTAEQSAAGPVHPRIQLEVDTQGLAGTHTAKVVTQYDNYGRTVRTVVDGLGGTQVTSEEVFDARGRHIGSTLPHDSLQSGGPTILYSYDGLDRITAVDQSGGGHAEHRYASPVTLDSQYDHWLDGIDCGNAPALACVAGVQLNIDEEGKQSVSVTDHRGLVLRSIDGNNVASTQQVSEYVYGAHDMLRFARDNDGNTTSFTYDDYGRLKALDRPGITGLRYTYNGFDALASVTKPDGLSRTFHRDALARLTAIDDAQGTTTWIYDQGPNAVGQLSSQISPASAANPDGLRIDLTYAPGFLKQVDYTIDGTDYAVVYDRDDLGRIVNVHYPHLGGTPIVVQQGYDPASGTMSSLSEIGSGTSKPLWRMNDQFAGILTKKETFGNGATTTYGYNPDRYWLENIDTLLGGQSIQSLSYSHYQNGLVFHRTTTTGTTSTTRQHFYDPLNRLAGTSDSDGNDLSYGYDNVGNITQRGSSIIRYKPGSPYFVDTVDSSSSYYYDANGDVEIRTGPEVRGGEQTFTYTPFDLPSNIVTGTGNSSKTTTFEYSADERRLVERDSDSGEVLHFVGGLYERKLSSANATLEERFRLKVGAREIGEIVRANGADETLYFHADNLGSIDTISSDGARTPVHQAYDVFGTPPALPDPALSRAGFTGQEHDRDLELIDMKGRIYDPLAARFLTPDLGYRSLYSTQGLNPYSYVFNDPINSSDPSGLFSLKDLGGDIVGGVVALGHIAATALISYELGVQSNSTFAWSLLGAGQSIGNVGLAGWSIAHPVGRAQQPRLIDNILGPHMDKMPGQCELNPNCTAQNAGDPSNGTQGRGNSASDVPASPTARQMIIAWAIIYSGGRVLYAPAAEWLAAEEGGTSVIGSFPEYVEYAEEEGFRYSSVSPKFWSSMARNEQWDLLQEYLDEGIAQGNDFHVVASEGIREGTWLEQEVSYLESQGYTWSPAGNVLVPP